MKIVIEGKEVEFELPEKELLLSQVIQEVEDFLFSVGRIPISLIFNGQELTQEEMDAKEASVMQGSEVLEFGVMDIIDFVIDNLSGAKEANSELLQLIEEFCSNINTPGYALPSERLTAELGHFFDFWIKLTQLLPHYFASIEFGEQKKSVVEWLDGMRSLFDEIVQAMDEDDFVLAADLLQYEVSEAVKNVDAVIPILQEKLEKVNTETEEEKGSAEQVSTGGQQQ